METNLQSEYNTKIVKFSIIIPVYNVEKYLQECLDSIISQDLKDFEVICINDGSTDNSLTILEDYAKKDSRFKILSQENQGQGIARNIALERAQGEYLFFIDSDDFIEHNTLSTIYEKLKQSNADIVQFDYATCKDNGKYHSTCSYQKKLKKVLGYSIKSNQTFNWNNFEKKNLLGISLYVWDKVYKTDLIKQNNIKFAPNKHGEDHIFSISAVLLANKILYLRNAFYHYRTRLSSAVNKASDDNFCIFENIELIRRFLVEHNLLDEYKTGLEEYMLSVLSWHYSCIPLENIDKYLNKCKELLNAKNYELLLKKTKLEFSFFEKLFSLKNHKIDGIKTKCITFLGISVNLNPKKKGV